MSKSVSESLELCVKNVGYQDYISTALCNKKSDIDVKSGHKFVYCSSDDAN